MPPFPSNLHGNIATIPMSLHLPSPKLSFFLLLLMVSLVADAKYSTIPAWLDCPSVSPSPSPSPSPAPQASTNTTFRTNLLALLGDLPAAAAPTGFASLSRGAAFVRGLCRGDVAPGDCVACLNTAVQNITASCSSGERAAAWYEKCFVAYADTNASTEREESYRQLLYNAGKVSNPRRFENAYSTLMNLLAARAVNGSARMFATGEANYSAAPNGTLYGLVQCSRDRAAADCDRCLRDSVQQLPACGWGQQGGVVLGYNCYLRVEIYTYYDLALNAPPPAAPTPPSVHPPFTAERHGKKRSRNTVYEVAFPVGTILIIVSVCGAILHRRRIMAKRSQNVDTQEGITSISLTVLKTATANFSKENKLGEGGFGEVFKGVMPDGQIIAVKRLSKNSLQGFHELKNELVLAAKLKHRNLVQLLGVCSQGKLLVYEYMPNRSLDTALFDPERRRQLDWTKRYMIIQGIARGLLYLHEESHLKIIHRDLKPSNVLLDMDMNCKISDFGLARAFGGDQSIDITKRPVGTLGYMSPEYAYCGHVSTKCDMYSFGVIILEIVTGRKNNNSYEHTNSKSLLSYVWERWNMRSMAELVDPSLGENYHENEVFSCIQIGLLCVQENPSDRPDVSKVVLMLNDQSTSVPAPSRPAYYFGSHAGNTAVFSTTTRNSRDIAAVKGHQPLRAPISDNEVTISELEPR